MRFCTTSSDYSSERSTDFAVTTRGLIEKSHVVCNLIDRVPEIGQRLLSSPMSFEPRGADYTQLLETNSEVLGYVLQVSSWLEVGYRPGCALIDSCL